MKTSKCLYCGKTVKENELHFQSSCCGRGMCNECYQDLRGTDEQLQLINWDKEEIEEAILLLMGWQNEGYICIECFNEARKQLENAVIYAKQYIDNNK